MQLDLLLDIQRKVIGGYINAEEFGNKEILNETISEELFNLTIHKAVARACNKLRDNDIPITEYTVFDFLQKYNLPKSANQQAEYLHIASEWAITLYSFKNYVDMILQHKMES